MRAKGCEWAGESKDTVKGWKALDVIFPSRCTNGSHVKKRGKYCTVKSTNTDDATSHYFSLRQESIDLLQVNLGFLSKQYFSHLCHCELPKVNTNSEATSWAEPCLWPLRGFEPIFTWQTQWSVEVKKKEAKWEKVGAVKLNFLIMLGFSGGATDGHLKLCQWSYNNEYVSTKLVCIQRHIYTAAMGLFHKQVFEDRSFGEKG